MFCLIGLAVGGLGQLLHTHVDGITRVLGGVTILLGLMFFGAFDRFTFAGRIFKPSVTPRAGLLGAPLLGVMFGVGWTPCIGPTLTAVLALSAPSGTAARGAFLAFVYGLGLGIPFLIVAALLQRAVGVLGFFQRNARMVSRIGGALLVVVGLLEVTGAWTSAIVWLRPTGSARTRRRCRRPAAIHVPGGSASCCYLDGSRAVAWTGMYTTVHDHGAAGKRNSAAITDRQLCSLV